MKTVRRVFGRLALGLVLTSVGGSPVLSSTSATITGRVTDSQGLVVPDAQVQVTNILTNISYSGETNEDGLYRITNLPPGEYRVIVQKQGFASIAKPSIELHVQDIITLNFSLQVGSVSQTVTVEAGANLVQIESGSVSTVIDRRFVERLPLNGRSFNTLLQLTPGVSLVPAGGFNPGQFSVNGQRSSANYFQVDGVSVNFGVTTNGQLGQAGGGSTQAFNAYGGTSSLVSVDAMEEFRVQTSTFAPEYGRAPGGQISIITRSGTNEFHGGIFDYFRNDKLDANDWFANAAGRPRAALRQNDFGGFLGGPLYRNKTFFFFSYEGLRLRLPVTRVISVPSLAIRASALPSVAPLLNAYPKPNGPVAPSGNTAQFTGTYSDQSTLDATSLRLDHTFNSKWTLFGRYNYAPSSAVTRINSLVQVDSSKVNTRTLTIGASSAFNATLSNTIRGNYSVQGAGLSSGLDSFGDATPLDPTLLLPAPLSSLESRASFFTNDTSFYAFGPQSRNRVRQFNLHDDLAKTVGTRNLKFGVDYTALYLDVVGFRENLSYSAPAVQTVATTGTANLFTAVRNRSKILARFLSLYAQDSWKTTARLTLTYGLRWEFNPAPRGRDGTILAAWENVDDPAATVLAPAGTRLWKSRYTNFAPRLGFAYSVTSKGDLVVRGGWGLFYDIGTGSVADLGTVFPNSANRSSPSQTLPIANVGPLLPVISLQPPYQGSFIEGFSPNLKLPRSQQWNVAIEKAFWGQQAISLTYVGQAGRRLLRREDALRPNPNFTNVFALVRNRDESDYHAMQIQFRRMLSSGLQALANYTWSHSIDTGSEDAVDVVSGTVITNQGDRGSSRFDVRHNFSAAVSYSIPTVRKARFLEELSKNWTVDTLIQVRSAFPVDVKVAGVVPVPGTTTRPDLVPGVPVWLPDPAAPGGKRLNPAAFSIPTQPRQGTLGRNSIYGFGFTQVDLSVGRAFKMVEHLNLQFRADIFNLLNHPNFTDPNGRVGSSPLFLQSTQMLNRGLGGLSPLYQQGGPRSTQLSLRLQF